MKNLSLIILLSTILLPQSWANKKNDNVEKIQVTGSRIKRINIEGPSPITVIESEELEQSPYNTVGEVLAEKNINPFGGLSVHSTTTLILINGRRVVEHANESVSLETAPIEAIERIEIIKDGSSAIYGSDAVGGVINFVLKKDFNGLQIQTKVIPVFYPYFDDDKKINFYTGGNEFTASVLWGKSYAKGYTTALIKMEAGDAFYIKDRPSEWYGDVIFPYSPHAVFSVQNGKPIYAPGCPQQNRQNNRCYNNVFETVNIGSNGLGFSGYIESVYRNKGIEYYFQSLPSFGFSSSTGLPVPGDILLKSGHKLSVGGGQQGTLYYLFEEAGNRKSVGTGFVIDNTFGAKGYFNSIWDWDLSFKASGTLSNSGTKNDLLKDKTIEAIYSGQFDPFTTDKRNLDSSFIYDPNIRSSSFFLSSDFITTGAVKIFDVALGLQAYYNKYISTPDDEVFKGNVVGYSKVSKKNDDRYVFSGFAEATYAPIDKLEVQIAGRVDQYQDILTNHPKDSSTEEESETYSKFRLTANPKLAFRYQASDNFLIRGSIGTSFVAPSLENINRPSSRGYVFFTDYKLCFDSLKKSGAFQNFEDEEVIKDFFVDQRETFQRKDLDEDTKSKLSKLIPKLQEDTSCQASYYSVKYQGNKDLKETKGLTASLSSVFQINKDSSLILDLWFLRTSNRPSFGVSSDTILAALKLGEDHVNQQGIIINRDSNGNILSDGNEGLTGFETALFNIGEQKLAGLDFAFSSFFSNKSYKGGNFYFKDEGNIALYSQFQRFPGLGFTDAIGKSGTPRWRNIADFGWTNKKHDISLKWHFVSSTLKARNELESLPISHRLDVSYVWYKDVKTTVSAGFQNFLNTTRIDDSIVRGGRVNTALHDSRGPHLYFHYKKSL